jgi:hypothetical protein
LTLLSRAAGRLIDPGCVHIDHPLSNLCQLLVCGFLLTQCLLEEPRNVGLFQQPRMRERCTIRRHFVMFGTLGRTNTGGAAQAVILEILP